MSFKKDINKVAKKMTRLVKDEILRQGLVDTGALLRSIRIKKKITKNGVDFEIIAVDYYEFVDERFRVTEQAFSGVKYDEVLEDLADAIEKEVERKLITKRFRR